MVSTYNQVGLRCVFGLYDCVLFEEKNTDRITFLSSFLLSFFFSLFSVGSSCGKKSIFRRRTHNL